ncbi:DUF6542 domain-containing protein [Kitasatospora paranensis]|uniref:DUF6542 domain-containing protein n=1 Tax=Kitasatospora paranensis TaxID=258053 RepID=UPI0031E8FA57
MGAWSRASVPSRPGPGGGRRPAAPTGPPSPPPPPPPTPGCGRPPATAAPAAPAAPALAGPRPDENGPPARLTAVGTGVAAVAGTLVAAGLDRLVFGGLGVLFGLGYLAVCFQLAVRVRLHDLPAAPISGPIAFALALLLLGPVAAPGLTGQVVGLAGGLAVRAGWLFSGTGLAVVITAARFVAQRRLRRAR